MNYQIIVDQRKALISIQSHITTKELLSLIEEIKIHHPNLRQTIEVTIGDAFTIELIKSCGFKQDDRLSNDSFEWTLPEFDEGCYGLNGCGG